MDEFQAYLDTMNNPKNRDKLNSVLEDIRKNFPFLTTAIKWKQPMFLDHGTFIIGFSVSKHHFSVAPEKVVLDHFETAIKKSGYDVSKMLFKIKWTDTVDYELLRKIVAYTVEKKKDCQTFWWNT